MGRCVFPWPLRAGILIVLCIGPLSAEAQLVMGQYEDEAPLRSWNFFGGLSASAMGLGDARFALAEGSSAAMTNPALLVTLPVISASITGSLMSATLNKYSVFNTGVISSPENARAVIYGLETAGFSIVSGGWAFGVTAALLENYGRPRIDYSFVDETVTLYAFQMNQEGLLRNINVAVARRLARNISVGLGFNLVKGELSRLIDERWTMDEIAISDDKSEKFSGFFLNGGLYARPSSRLSAALVFRAPYIKKGKGQSRLRYQALQTGTDIRIDAESDNEYRQPLVVGTGICYRISENILAAADFSFFGWSRYAVTYFEEPLDRSFRNILKASAGFEYRIATTLGGRAVRIPLRFGLSHDPQPMKEPRSSYLYISAGSGIHRGALAIDLSGRLGWEKGSGHRLKAAQAVLTVSYSYDHEN